MTVAEGFNRGRSHEFGPDTAVRSWVATERYCGPELAGLFGYAGAYLQEHWEQLRNSNRLAHFLPQRELPWPLPPSIHFVPGYMYEQWWLRFDDGHFHAFLESCPDGAIDGEPLAGARDWHVQHDPRRSGNKWSATGVSRVSQAWRSAIADADSRRVQKLTWCYQAGNLEGVRSPNVYLRDRGTRIWCEIGSRARIPRTERYVDVVWGGMRRTEAVTNSTAQHLGQLLRELERIVGP
jgi:hypothetical protein